MAADTLELIALSKETIPQWLSLKHSFLDYGMTERKLAKHLGSHAARRELHYLVMDGTTALAKISAEVNVANCLEFWHPAFKADLDEATRDRCADLLLDRIVAEAKARSEVTYLESKPSEDIPDALWWLGCLSRAGFSEISVGHVFLLTRDPRDPLPPVPAHLTFRPINQLDPELVVATYGRIIASTLDRADGSAPETPKQRLESRKRTQYFDFHPSNWLFCFMDDKPVGFIFTCLEKLQPPTAALLMEGGIVPEARGQGLYTHLIRKGIQVAAAKGITRIYGRTDDHNPRPTAVLIKEGFTRLPSRNWIYRMVLDKPQD